MLLAALLGLGVAHAAEEDSTQVKGLRMSARYGFPQRVGRGYWPLNVTVDNTASDAQDLEIRVTPLYGWGQEGTWQELHLEPGEHVELEFMLPAWLDYPGNVTVSALRDDVSIASLHNMGPDESIGWDELAYIVVSQNEGDLTREEQWRDAFGMSVYGGGVITAHDDLPSEWIAYTCLDAVVIPTSEGLPPEAAMGPILEWLRSGGNVIVTGPGAEQLVDSHPGLSSWAEDRFLHVDLEWDQYAAGKGRLFILEGAKLESWALNGITSSLRDGELQQWSPGTPYYGGPSIYPVIPGIGNIPAVRFSLLMLIVAFTLGPANYLLVRLLKRPSLLLVTTPVLALGSTGVLVGYGITSQGLGVKTASYSYTLLDQRAHRASTSEMRQLFAGRSPGKGLRPGDGTWHFAPERDWNFKYEMQHSDEGRLVSGDMLPVRVAFRTIQLSEGPSRLRVEVDGDQLENGLGVDIESIIVMKDGAFYQALDVGAGQTAQLRPVDRVSLDVANYDIWDSEWDNTYALRPPLRDGTWVAQLPRSPFIDHDGLEPKELAGHHVVVGVME